MAENNTGPDRRNFLKSAGLAAASAVVETQPALAATARFAQGTQSEIAQAERSVDLANVLQGTDSTYAFSRGNTLPIAAVPFGMAHWTLQSEARSPWMFQPGARRLQGFRCTHQLSPWLSDYGQALFLPFSGETKPEPNASSSSWRPEDAALHPYSFKLSLLRYQLDAELVPTTRCASISGVNSSGMPSGFLIEVPKGAEPVDRDEANHTIRFKSAINEGGVPANFATYYVVRFAAPWRALDVSAAAGRLTIVARFGDPKNIEARIATSFISFEQAQKNLDLELGTKPIDQIRSESKSDWAKHFERMQVEGGTDRQQRTFYSCLYRALLFPRTFHEPDDAGQPHHYSAYNGKIEPGVMYADHGYWDVYRAWYPWMSIVFPERLGEILQAWVNAYKEGGWLPQFPAPGYRACMTGSLIDSLFGEAAAKGIKGFDLAAAYDGLKKHATQPGDPDKGYGRRGVEDYLKLGYCSVDHVDQAAAETVDAAYGDFCIAQVAKALGRDDDAAMFTKRSQNWKNIFDPKTSFFRGKHADGSWLEPFDEVQWGNPYVEGSAWQHRWDAPHDIDALFTAMGGKEKAAAALEKMLTMDPVFHVGVYGQEIHEMSEMAAVNFGQYDQGNQPDHHVLYLFALAGRPDRTQYWVRRVMDELYSPDTFAGDEDTGAMAAWYLMSAMGIYAVCPAKPEYVLGRGYFPAMTVRVGEGKTLRIESTRSSSTARASLNGKAIEGVLIPHAALSAGGRLTFA
ncbi:GH92 family glycosyl hydrolase [Occallatibacter savannae]|uniref:GH92 family glycosyl hydrolase n=1 Tax=Occallatibacter savannae TaxID=1002691 RepID=UPI000D69E9A5|nr:GH92 family glycosyl hydrolase [Occallatibacter savannae]